MSAVAAMYHDDCWAALDAPHDLSWDQQAITDRNEALAFIQRFESRLCIYSHFEEALYGQYTFVMPSTEHGSITILPNQNAWHSTFQAIPAAAIEPTGVHILPGEVLGHSGVYLKIPNKCRLLASSELPFQNGLRLLIKRYREENDDFLPVLLKRDLRSYESRMPSLELYRINPAHLTHMSSDSIRLLRKAVVGRLLTLFAGIEA
ncbi:hypothetical protein [Pseudomonas sp. MS19]|uniref:hypothetical protein n=1 Tax=Pseudomonas sp. MS19 TaxID=2579939 RepID=UPI0015623A2B|nr:hypothetical protein [Pseudomonas sp. MS19]NRH28619.1 hypothetical protein [Pseudomonas sp. MS19]